MMLHTTGLLDLSELFQFTFEATEGLAVLSTLCSIGVLFLTDPKTITSYTTHKIHHSTALLKWLLSVELRVMSLLAARPRPSRGRFGIAPREGRSELKPCLK